ncbi:MAG TPA: hypothetical protein VF453_05655, partial [Burkholderiaceae bacterium]
MNHVGVAIDAPQHAGLGALLTYESPVPLAPGSLARVPLGRREVTGVVWECMPAADAPPPAASPDPAAP